jgi:HD superfamily phosphohydrolase
MKIFSDIIHGVIELSNTAIKIIDTPEFQRLRNIKQLGTCNYVFTNANHSRFEHSIGVAHLSKRMLFHFKNAQPTLNITDSDILCVELAGLCHDLGHGPFSHVFDNEFIPLYKSLHKKHIPDEYREHEDRSIALLKQINVKYNVGLSKITIDTIINMIKPPKHLESHYLYSIVANKITGIDVDKFDYMSRDTIQTGLPYRLDYKRLITVSRVIDNQICFPRKDAANIYDMFKLRFRLHKNICNHHCVKSIEYMLINVLKYIEEQYPIIEKVSNMEEFILLTDSIIDIPYILNIPKAIEMLEKIKRRNIYKLCYEQKIQVKHTDATEWFDEFKKYFAKQFNSDDYFLHKLQVSLTGENKHPIKYVQFYDKSDMTQSYTIQPHDVSALESEEYTEYKLRIFITSNNQSLEKEMINIAKKFNKGDWT